MVGRDQVDEGGLINGRMIEELVGGDKITRKTTTRVERGLESTLGSGSRGLGGKVDVI